MSKQFVLVAATSMLLASAAYAQSTNDKMAPGGQNAQPPAAADTMNNKPDTNAPGTTSDMKSDMNKSAAPAGDNAAMDRSSDNPATANASVPTGTAAVVSQQDPDQWLASNFNGTDVVGTDGKKIGDVNDILFNKDGSVQAVIVGVGGFLGIGEKDVALKLSSFKTLPSNDDNEKKLQLAMTKEELKNAPEFKRYEAPKPAAGTTGSTGMTGTPGMKPSAPAK